MTLSGLLSSNLSRDAHSAIFAVLSSDGRKGLANARLAFRGLRDLVDGAITHLTVSEPQRGCTLAEVHKLSNGGRWLQRWPHCSRLSLVGRESSVVLMLGAFPEPCWRITELEVDLPNGNAAGLPSELLNSPSSVAEALAELLRRMPELRALQLSTPAWIAQEGGVPLEGLPHLTSLSVNHLSWLGCMGPALSAQLTRLKVTLEGDDVLPSADLAAALAPMAALREFVLDGGDAIDYDAEDACVVLDALPPTVQRCSLGLVWWDSSGEACCGTLSCVFSEGLLASCCLKAGPETYFVDADATLVFLEAVLLPCTKLGQRLGLLELDVPLTSRPPDASTAAQLLRRCDAVRVTAVYEYGGTDAAEDEQRSTLALARVLGIPSKLNVWCNMSSLLDFNILLRPPPYPDTSSVAMACGRDEGGGSGGGSSGPAAAHPPLPTPRAVLKRALEAMLEGPGCSGGSGGGGGGGGGSSGGGSSSGSAGGGGWRDNVSYELLLRGAAICTLLQAAEEEQHAWVRAIRQRAAQGNLGCYRLLPAVHAIVLTCSSPEAVQAAAEAARQLGADVGQGAAGGEGSGGGGQSADSAGTGPEAGAAGGEGAGSGGGKRQREDPAADTLSPTPAATKFQAALAKVFQALWDGTEPGAPGPDVVGLERLQWLMEAVDRVLEPEGLPEENVLWD